MEGLPETGILDAALMVDEDDRSDADKVFEMMLDPANLMHFTELTKNEITAFSTLAVIADRRDLVVLKAWLVRNLSLRVSHKRGGRKDVIKIFSKMNNDQYNDHQGGGGFWGRRRGGGRRAP